jgi:predicted nucleotidyltransferase
MIKVLHRLPPLEQAVLATTAYSDSFDTPLLFEEVCERCLFVPGSQNVGLARSEAQKRKDIQHALDELIRRKLLEQASSPQGSAFYFLPGRKNVIAQRSARLQHAQAKKSEIDQVVRFLRRVPWVSAVYLTGSMAIDAATDESDIDFMIITLPERLWLTRILVSFYAQLQGKRRSWNHEEPGSWCFNLWLDTNHLAVEPAKRDVYRAYELLQAKLLLDKDNTDVCLAAENSWMASFFAISKETPATKCDLKQPFFIDQLPVLRQCFAFFDYLAWTVQHRYMKHHQTTERVGRGYAFFHPRDTKGEIFQKWHKSLERCLSKEEAIEILQPYVSAKDSSS